MGKKGKGYRREQEQQPVKKKNVITEQQLMDKSHMDRTQFIPLLAEDCLYQPFLYKQENEIAVKKIVTDLNYLLYTDFKNFWATVLYNPSLKNCLSSCLSFLHRRWMNCYRFSKESEEQFNASEENLFNYKRVKEEALFEYTEGLAQVILIIYHRIVSFNIENRQLSDLYKINEEISRKYILDFPKLFELAEIYGETNPEIVRYIVKMFSKMLPTFYQTLTSSILPVIFKRVEELIRRTKVVTEREEYGVNYSYKRLNGRQLSQGEEEFIKKTTILLQMVSFINIINSIINFFPDDCVDHCYFNSQVQFCFENIFLQLQAAYKIWDFQTQQIKLLNIFNFILKECLDYFYEYFDRCNDIIVLRNRRCATIEAYINSLGRMFKEFGKRSMMSKKNQVRNLLMYKILQKKIDLLKMAQTIYQQETEEEGENFNLEYLKDFIINMETETKDEYINEEEARQEEIEEETQAPQGEKEDDFDEKGEVKNEEKIEKPQEKTKEPEIEELEVMIPKRMRSEDYYSKLYANFEKKFYKGEYEDDYDDAVDFNKRPLFFQEQSSNSESESENERHLVSNNSNFQHVKSLHSNTRINRENTRVENANKPRYERVNNYPTNQSSNNNNNRQQQKVDKPKVKYVAKQNQETEIQEQEVEEKPIQQQINQQRPPVEGEEQKRGGQGYKKSGKSYRHKPKDHQPKDKHSNTNKNRDYNGGNGKKYRQK